MIFLKIRWKELLACLAVPLAVGGASAFLTRDGMAAFSSLKQPPLSPPQWLFPVAWTALYLLMGAASYLVKTSGGPAAAVRRALGAYGVQLAVNFFWPFLFFGLGWYLAALIWLVLLWALIAVTMARFSRVSRTAAWLLLPYLLWTAFAVYLNLGVYLLN